MYCDSAIAEYKHLVDGVQRIDSVLFLTDIEENDAPELLEIARVAASDSKTKRYFSWIERGHVDELRCFISVDLQYIVIKHISESEQEWSMLRGVQGVQFESPMKGRFQSIIRDLRDYLEKDDAMKTRLTSRKTVGEGKLVKRIHLKDLGIDSIDQYIGHLEEAFRNPQRATDDELVCLFFMERSRGDFDRKVNEEIRDRINDRFESREWEGQGVFELSEISIKELESRRERGRKNLRRFVSRFPGWMIGENGSLDDPIWYEQVFGYLRKLDDDELVELALVYFGAGIEFDSRTKAIYSVVQERL